MNFFTFADAARTPLLALESRALRLARQASDIVNAEGFGCADSDMLRTQMLNSRFKRLLRASFLLN
jgi:hypothetical protein